MHLSVGQKVTYDSKVDGFISAIARYSFTVDWLDGSTSTESLIDHDTKLKFHPLANEEPSVLKYVTCIQEKYPKEEKTTGDYQHYFKDVSKLKQIDIYRVLDLWEVQDPCIAHAVKKLLVAGNRGYKDTTKDIQEAIDSLNRWKEMQVENKGIVGNSEKDNA